MTDFDTTGPGLDQPEPDHPDVLAHRASELLDRNRLEMARSVLSDALTQHPTHTGLLYQAARADVLDERYQRAIDTLGRLLAVQPGHADARLLLFHIEMERDDLPQAEAIILDLLREYPQHPIFYACYARAMLRALHFEKAARLADEALHRAPNDDTCLRVKALCDIVEGRRGVDSAAFKRLIAQFPDDYYTLRLVVIALVHANRSREAWKLARDLLRAQPNDAGLLKLVRALHYENHWTMRPLWPMQRWGWAGSAGLWVGMLLVSQILSHQAPQYRGLFSTAWLALVIYSWAWPPLLKRWLDRDN